MTVNVSKPAINVREKLAELDKPTGIAGEAMLRAETPQEQFNLIGAGRRNLIINGAMQVAQRGTSVSVSGSTFSYDTVDRMEIGRANVDNIVVTSSQATDAPDGFAYSHKLDVTTAESAIASDEYYRGLQYTIEGQDLTGIGYGTSSAKPVTLSFWVKSSLAGTYSVAFYRDESTDRIYSTSYTVDAVGVWEYKTITVEGDTSIPTTPDNAGRLSISWHLFAGSNYKGGNIVGWENYSSATDLAADHAVDWGLSTDDYWQITGVQLELGKVATPFEHRSYGEELALCQRYYYRIDSAYNNANYQRFAVASIESGTQAEGFFMHPVEMRAIPTLGFSAASDFHVYTANVARAVSGLLLDQSSPTTAGVAITSTGMTAGNVGLFNADNNKDAFIEFKAEL